VGLLVALVAMKVIDLTFGGYDEAWAKAETAERAFYDAAAKELRGDARSL
jgi:hypothetical protein